ncbi:MAG: hypothetical protein HQ581_10785, partial [Planctomycetes bacterium]|nr:hypothetical protein [Planctomycetota bacterium]
MKRIVCHVVLLTLALSLAACSERPRQGDGAKKPPATSGEAAGPEGKESAGPAEKAEPAKTEQPAAPAEGGPQ